MRNRFILRLRIALVAEWLLVAVGVTAAPFLEPSLPAEPLGEAHAIGDDVAMGPLRWAAIVVSLLLWVTGSVGSFLLWRRGRIFYLAGVITGTASVPLIGIYGPPSPLEWAIAEASLIATGLALGILYFSPLRDHFGSASPFVAGNAKCIHG
jgi:hypothetical protein